MKGPRPSLHWRLRVVMAERDVRSSRALRALLVNHGITMSEAQISRVVKEMPANLNMHLLAAICRALSVTPGELILLPGHIAPSAAPKPAGAPVNASTVEPNPDPDAPPQMAPRHPTKRPRATALPIPTIR